MRTIHCGYAAEVSPRRAHRCLAALLGASVSAFPVIGLAADNGSSDAEYVRVCDVYGEGFLYIPGTQTCLKVGGYVRIDTSVGDLPDYGHGVDRYDDIDSDGDGIRDTGDGKGDTYFTESRFALQVDARSETDLGTLRGFVEIYFNNDYDYSGSTSYTDLEYAYIELGGLRIGKNDSLFATWTSYAGSIISDDLGVPYGPFDTNQIVYTKDWGGGINTSIALEIGAIDDGRTDYMPNLVGGISLVKDWGGISFVAAYDSVAEAGAAKIRLDLTASDKLSLFGMVGYSTNDPAGIGLGNVDSNNYYALWNGSWAVWAGANLQMTPKTALYAQTSLDEDRNFAAVADIAFTPVTGLTFTTEIAYRTNFETGTNSGLGGYLRLQRDF